MTSRLEQLRDSFDRTFAIAPRAVDEAGEDYLSIRLADEPYVVRVREVQGLHADRKIVPLPTTSPSLLGIAGIRGGLVPVFSLAALVRGAPENEGRWLILVGGDESVGLSFGAFSGYLRVPCLDLVRGSDGQELMRHAGSSHTVIQISSLLDTINAATPSG